MKQQIVITSKIVSNIRDFKILTVNITAIHHTIVKTQPNSTQINSKQIQSKFVEVRHSSPLKPTTHTTQKFSVTSRQARELKLGKDTH